jgi:1-acyl-sn-glycerol-3-phosphate acyltransferase
MKLSYNFRYKIAEYFSYIFIFLCKYIAGLNYTIEGMEKLPNTPSIVLLNHQSFWDNLIVQLFIPQHSWVLKRELFNMPLLGWGIKMLEPIDVDRSDHISVNKILREGQKKLSNGLWVIIFPEATRCRPGSMTRFKPSAVKLASMAKVPIIMVAHNAGMFWPKGLWIKPGHIHVKIIDIIEIDEIISSETRELTTKIENIIHAEKQILESNFY